MFGDILYIDDQALHTGPLRDFLASETGRTVHNARSISEALEVLDRSNATIALVLLDVMMASGDQAEIARRDPNGFRTGLEAVPLLRARLGAGKEIWLVTVRRDLIDQELQAAGIPRSRVYTKPIRDVAAFLKDVTKYLES